MSADPVMELNEHELPEAESPEPKARGWQPPELVRSLVAKVPTGSAAGSGGPTGGAVESPPCWVAPDVDLTAPASMPASQAADDCKDDDREAPKKRR